MKLNLRPVTFAANAVDTVTSALRIMAMETTTETGVVNNPYYIDRFDPTRNPGYVSPNLPGSLAIYFQNGDPDKVGVNGVTIESLMMICADRLQNFQKGPYACVENQTCINNLLEGIEALQVRFIRETTKDQSSPEQVADFQGEEVNKNTISNEQLLSRHPSLVSDPNMTITKRHEHVDFKVLLDDSVSSTGRPRSFWKLHNLVASLLNFVQIRGERTLEEAIAPEYQYQFSRDVQMDCDEALAYTLPMPLDNQANAEVIWSSTTLHSLRAILLGQMQIDSTGVDPKPDNWGIFLIDEATQSFTLSRGSFADARKAAIQLGQRYLSKSIVLNKE